MTAADQELCPKPTLMNGETAAGKKSARGKLPAEIGTDWSFKREIVWKNAIGFLILHLAGLYGLYMFRYCKLVTIVWAIVSGLASAEGVTIGAHRLYSHKTYKAKFGMRLVLIILQTIAGQNCLYIWARDHRLHHKYSDTDADPHNATRGFFFSHIGWLMSKKHPAVIEKGKTIDLSDLEADWLVMYQKKYYKPLYAIFAIALPVLIPVYGWNETYWNSFFVSYMFRYVVVLNATWSVNSAAHLWGTKPFDQYMLPVESNFVAFISIGEGWHNYHHTFPWDYRAAEFGSRFCVTTYMIDLCAYFGWAYDLKTAPYHMIKSRSVRSGDGTHPIYGGKIYRFHNANKVEVISNPSESGKLSKIEATIIDKGKKIIPEVSHRVVTIQG